MNKETVILTFDAYWRFKDHHHLKITRCKKIIDTKRGKLLRYHTRGFFINGKYIKKNKLNQYIEVIPKYDIQDISDWMLTKIKK